MASFGPSGNGSTVTVTEKSGTVTVKKHAGPGAWTLEEEHELVKLFQRGASLEALAEKFQRSPRAIRLKLQRLGVNLAASKLDVTADLPVPEELPSLEEVLKIVAAAIYKACQGGLGKTELQRLGVIATLYKAYAEGLEQYVGYRKIEAKLLELEKKYGELAEKAQSNASKPNTS